MCRYNAWVRDDNWSSTRDSNCKKSHSFAIQGSGGGDFSPGRVGSEKRWWKNGGVMVSLPVTKSLNSACTLVIFAIIGAALVILIARRAISFAFQGSGGGDLSLGRVDGGGALNRVCLVVVLEQVASCHRQC